GSPSAGAPPLRPQPLAGGLRAHPSPSLARGSLLSSSSGRGRHAAPRGSRLLRQGDAARATAPRGSSALTAPLRHGSVAARLRRGTAPSRHGSPAARLRHASPHQRLTSPAFTHQSPAGARSLPPAAPIPPRRSHRDRGAPP